MPPSKGTHFKRQTTSYAVSYGVMVAQQVLVLFVVVRIRLGQQKKVIQKNHLFCMSIRDVQLNESASSAPALNLATFFAAILIFSLVEGLIPSRAARSETLKVPKPMS